MPDSLLKHMTKDQLEDIAHHMIHSSPFGIVILDNMLNAVFVNDVIKTIFYIDEDVLREKLFLGNIFSCKYVEGTDTICGTNRQCENCKIRNTLLNASYFDRVIENIRVKHSFIKNNIEVVKWFDLSVIPTKVEGSPHLILLMNDQTDFMNQKIDRELSGLLTLNDTKSAKTLFSKLILQSIHSADHDHVDGVMLKLDCSTAENYKPEMKKAFNMFTLQHIGDKTPYYQEHENSMVIFFIGVASLAVDTFIAKVDQFCDLNYEHHCKPQKRVLRVDVSQIKMNPQITIDQLEQKLDVWLEYINDLKDDTVANFTN